MERNFGGDFYNPETGKVTASDLKIVDALQWKAVYAKEWNIEDIASYTQGSEAMSTFISG